MSKSVATSGRILRSMSVVRAVLLIAGAALVAGCSSSTHARTDVLDQSAQAAMTPASVLADLQAGNARYATGHGTAQDWLAQAATTASDGQYPKAVVLSCIDSRVLPEMVFDQGIGDLFVGRVAGNCENVDQLGSMEYGAVVAGSKLIVVLGHTSCGAVKGTIDRVDVGNITALLANIEPAVAGVETGEKGRTSKDTEYVNRVVEANVRRTVGDISTRSPVLAERVSSGDLAVVGAVYDLHTGTVRWLD